MTDDEWADIVDIAGRVVGRMNVTTMRALAPHPELDEVIAGGGAIFMLRKDGMRISISPDPPKKSRRRRR
jgi:hypothetical protein